MQRISMISCSLASPGNRELKVAALSFTSWKSGWSFLCSRLVDNCRHFLYLFRSVLASNKNLRAVTKGVMSSPEMSAVARVEHSWEWGEEGAWQEGPHSGALQWGHWWPWLG